MSETLRALVQEACGMMKILDPRAEREAVSEFLARATAALEANEIVTCRSCQGRGWVMRSEDHDLGNGLRSGGAWNAPCPTCSHSAGEGEP